jgi:hypothetical protein
MRSAPAGQRLRRQSADRFPAEPQDHGKEEAMSEQIVRGIEEISPDTLH